MKVRFNFISREKEENAVLNLYEDNKKKDEMAAYLRSDGGGGRAIVVTENGRMVYLSGREIFHVEAEKNVRLVYTADKVYHSQYKLYELEELLPAFFVRTSKSTILNIDKVRLYRPQPNGLMAAELINDTTAYISRSYVKNLLEKVLGKEGIK